MKIGNDSVCRTTAFYVPTYQAVPWGNSRSIRHYVRNPISGGLERQSRCDKCFMATGHRSVSHDGSRKCLFSRIGVRNEFDLLTKSLFRSDRFPSSFWLFHEMTPFAKHTHTHHIQTFLVPSTFLHGCKPLKFSTNLGYCPGLKLFWIVVTMPLVIQSYSHCRITVGVTYLLNYLFTYLLPYLLTYLLIYLLTYLLTSLLT